MSTPRKLDEELERLLADDGGEYSAIYRRLPRVDPPRRLDRNVLGEAARAVHGRAPRRQRWVVGFGSGAGLLLAAGIAWHVGQDAARWPSQQSTFDAPAFVPIRPLDTPAERQQESTPAPVTPMPTAPMTDSAQTRKEPAPPQQSARVARKTAPPQPSASIALPAPPSPPAPAPSPAPAAIAPTASTPFPNAAALSGDKPQTSVQTSKVNEHPTSNTDLAAPATTRARSAAGSKMSPQADSSRDTQLAPQDWLVHIKQLVHEGRRQQAIESLRLFRQAHPDWPLSDEFRALDR